MKTIGALASGYGCIYRRGNETPAASEATDLRMVRRGAFTATLNATRDGRHVVRLLIDHDRNRELCSTADHSLVLQSRRGGLYAWVDCDRPGGRRALDWLLEHGSYRSLSVGCRSKGRVVDIGGTRVFEFTRETLDEVSVVETGAFPNTFAVEQFVENAGYLDAGDSGYRVTLRGTATVDQGDEQRTFSLVANTGEPMRLGNFEFPVLIDLDGMALDGLPVPALYDHTPDVSCVVGQVETAVVVNGELHAVGVFTPTGDPDDIARHIIDRADAGFEWQTSVGADPTKMELVRQGESASANGRVYPGPLYVARESVLREISFVVLGADRHTSAVVASDAGGFVPTPAPDLTHFWRGLWDKHHTIFRG